MSHYSRLCLARDYLASRFNQRTSLAEAAAQAGLSPFYFHRLFAEAFSETPHEFVTRLRIEHAKKLLSRTAQKVESIAHDSGYQSINSFCVAFKRATGMSAKQFRDRMNRQTAS